MTQALWWFHNHLSYEAAPLAWPLSFSRMLTLFSLLLVFSFAARKRQWSLAACALVPVVYYVDVLLAMHLLNIPTAPKLITVVGNIGFAGVLGWAYLTARRQDARARV